jgi:16S rRNA C1402 N4-methylase RsmH
MVHGLTKLLTLVMTAKRDLKRVYYTQRGKEEKLDSKELVASIIGVQRLLEELVDLRRKRRAAKKVLEDRKAELTLRRWSTGLPQRVKGFIDKSKKLEQHHLTKYQQSLLDYLNEMGEELAKWIEDIHTLVEIPKIPKDR